MKITEVTTITKSTKQIPIKFTEINSFISKKCPIAFNKPFRLYRGMPRRSEMMFGDSSLLNRRSANTSNHYTLLIDYILNSWNKFPKRSKSFICSTNSDRDFYGITYEVYPVGNPLIGICPSEDMWDSFKIEIDQIGNVFSNLAYILSTSKKKISNTNKISHNIFDILSKNKTISNNDTLSDITNIISLADKNWHDLMFEPKLKYTWSYFSPINLAKFQSFSQLLENTIDPIKNKFKLYKLSEMPNVKNREIWFSGPAYFVRNW